MRQSEVLEILSMMETQRLRSVVQLKLTLSMSLALEYCHPRLEEGRQLRVCDALECINYQLSTAGIISTGEIIYT